MEKKWKKNLDFFLLGWALHWVNKPEAKELFEFLNPHLKLPDRRALGG